VNKTVDFILLTELLLFRIVFWRFLEKSNMTRPSS